MNLQDFTLGLLFGVPIGVFITVILLLALARFAESRPYLPGPFDRKDLK